MAEPTLAFKYGCQPPSIEAQAHLRELMDRRVALWNTFVAIDRHFERSLDAFLRSEVPAFDVAAGALDLAKQALREAKAARTVRDDPAYLLAREDADDAQRAYWAARRQALQEESAQTARQFLDGERYAAVLAAKPPAQSGLHWMDADDVQQAYDIARQMVGRPKPGSSKPAQLQFHRPNEAGRIAVRIRPGLAVDDLFTTGHPMLHIASLDDDAYTHPSRSSRRRKQQTIIRVAIGLPERGQKLWIELPVVLHRPLPPGGTIQSISLQTRHVANQTTWSIVFTVRVTDVALLQAQAQRQGTVAINDGWRVVPDGLRVATWRDNSGYGGSMILPQAVLRGFEKVDDLKAIRERHFNEARLLLQTWLVSQYPESLPLWLRQATATLGQWYHPERLVTVLSTWRQERFVGDTAILEGDAGGSWEGHERLQARVVDATGHLVQRAAWRPGLWPGLLGWLARERHLHDYEDHLYDQLLKHRQELYRRFAAQLATQYAEVHTNALDLNAFVRLKGQTRQNRVLASLSTLRQALKNACARRGVPYIEQDATDITRACHACGSLQVFRAAAELQHACTVCGATWDQDANAVLNLLKRQASPTVRVQKKAQVVRLRRKKVLAVAS